MAKGGIFDSKDTESTSVQSEGHQTLSPNLECNYLRTKVVYQL